MTEDISPNVKTLESNFINNCFIEPSRNIALYVGEFEKGEINKPILITNALQFKQLFGRATEKNFNSWYQIYNFLLYPGFPKIWVCRVAGSNSRKSYNNGNIANTEGSWGNLLTVEIYNKNELYNYKYLREVFGVFNNIEINQFKKFLVIIKRNEKIVENFSLDRNDELNSFYLEQINLFPGIYKLNNGIEEPVSPTELLYGYELFSKENYDIDIVLSDEKFNQFAINFVETRRDCIAFLGVPREFVDLIIANNNILRTESGIIIKLFSDEFEYSLKNNIAEVDYDRVISYIKDLKKSQFVFFVFGFKYQLDKFTGKNKLINITGDIAGLKAKASSQNPWSIGAGVEKGKIKEFISIPMKINKKQMDELYKYGVNVLQNDILLSQKLFLTDESKINRLNQRNILNYLERASEKLLRRYTFTLNERNIRANIATELKKILLDMVASRGIEGGKVIVKPDGDKIIINIYIKIVNITEFVNLKISNTGTNSISTTINI